MSDRDETRAEGEALFAELDTLADRIVAHLNHLHEHGMPPADVIAQAGNFARFLTNTATAIDKAMVRI